MLKKVFWSTLFICLFSQFSHADDDVCAIHNCQIVVDAGSSGTRMHFYYFDKDENSNPINIKELQTNKIEPGFADLQPEEVANYLVKLMSPIHGNNTSVHFYATAGMRLLPEEKQQELFAKAHEWFAENPEWNLIDARTISGAEEGVFGWLGLYHSLGDVSFELPGFIEIGGASLQVVFPISNYTGINRDNIYTVNVKGRRLNLFAHSFLGMGANKIKEKFSNYESCYPVGFPMDNGELGQGEGLNCQRDILSVLNANNYISHLVKLTLQRNPITSWHTVGAISSISTKAPLNYTDSFVADDFFMKSSSTYCQQDWVYQLENYAASDKYLVQNCIISAFFQGIITEGFGISPQQTFFTDVFNSDWTIGALIAEIETEHHS